MLILKAITLQLLSNCINITTQLEMTFLLKNNCTMDFTKKYIFKKRQAPHSKNILSLTPNKKII